MSGYTEAGVTAAQELSTFQKCSKTVPHWEVMRSPLPEVFKQSPKTQNIGLDCNRRDSSPFRFDLLSEFCGRRARTRRNFI